MILENNKNQQHIYQQALLEYLPKDVKLFFYWKGRVGLYALLRAMGIGSGDEVILPGFSCVVVANAIIYLGATPIYVDIEADIYCPSLASIKALQSSKTKAVICQNTFGYSHQVDEIAAWARTQGIYSIEDCTHGFGGLYNGKPNGSFCDASFFSTQWNKPFSTGIGGFVSTKDKQIMDCLTELEQTIVQVSWLDSTMLRIQLCIRHYLPQSLFWIARRVYRYLSQRNWILGSSSGSELDAPVYPKHYFKQSSFVQINKGILALKDFKARQSQRQKNARRYTDYLSSHQKTAVSESLFANHSFLCYPMLVKDKAKFFELAELAKIPVGDWFCSPIHPVLNNWERWQLNIGSVPQAQYISQRIINLPTDLLNVDKIIAFLDKQKSMII